MRNLRLTLPLRPAGWVSERRFEPSLGVCGVCLTPLQRSSEWADYTVAASAVHVRARDGGAGQAPGDYWTTRTVSPPMAIRTLRPTCNGGPA